MYETNIKNGNELYFFKEDKVFSNMTLKEIVDVQGALRVNVRDDGLLHVIRVNKENQPTEEAYDALGNKILKTKRNIVFGVTGCGEGDYLFSPVEFLAETIQMPFKCPYRVTKNIIIQYNEKEGCYHVCKKNGTMLAKGKECALFQVKSGEYFALLNERGTWDLYDQNGKMDSEIQGMESVSYEEYEGEGEFVCQHKYCPYPFDVETDREKQKKTRNTLLFYLGFGAFVITSGYLGIKGAENIQKTGEKIEKTPASVLYVDWKTVYFDTDGDKKTVELCAEISEEDTLEAGYTLGQKKGKVMPISKWRTLKGLQHMDVREM